MTFFTSDLHLGHRNIIRLCGRPFASLEEMDETLVRRWNRKVGQDDNVFVVGDLFFRAEDPEGLLKRLNGRKTLILGNHDRSWTDTVDLARYFKGVHTMLETSDGAHSLTLCHYPMMTFNHCMRGYMVHGHIHGNTDADYFPYLAKHERILNAPDAIFHDGKWRIFYCMPDKSHSEGVASADAIAGPFKTTFAYSRPRRIVPRPQRRKSLRRRFAPVLREVTLHNFGSKNLQNFFAPVAVYMWYNMTQLGQVIEGEEMVVEMPIPTMVNSIAEAKAHFSAIVDAASAGKSFVICRAGRPLVTITQYVQPKPIRRPGALKGKIRIADDFDALPDGFEEAFG